MVAVGYRRPSAPVFGAGRVRRAMARYPLPAWLKRAVLPMWNAGHHAAWRAGEIAEALASRRLATCAICGRFGPMLYRRWVIPPRLEEMWGLSPALAEALARKESLDCWRCGGKLRARRLAEVFLELYPVGTPPAPAASIRDWAAAPEAITLSVAEINRIDGLHEALEHLPRFTPSEYREGVAPGTVVGGCRCEDLSRLTYDAEVFDLVLSSETLEHVPDLDAALAEIRRILKPGGRHIFTVPLLPGVERSFRRTDRICHPGGDTGYPVVTEFGADLPHILEEHGFDPEVRFGPVRPDDLAQVWVATRR